MVSPNYAPPFDHAFTSLPPFLDSAHILLFVCGPTYAHKEWICTHRQGNSCETSNPDDSRLPD